MRVRSAAFQQLRRTGHCRWSETHCNHATSESRLRVDAFSVSSTVRLAQRGHPCAGRHAERDVARQGARCGALRGVRSHDGRPRAMLNTLRGRFLASVGRHPSPARRRRPDYEFVTVVWTSPSAVRARTSSRSHSAADVAGGLPAAHSDRLSTFLSSRNFIQAWVMPCTLPLDSHHARWLHCNQ